MFTSWSTCSIRHWNVAGALCKPNGIQLYSKKPTPGNENAVLCLSDSSISICQYQFFKSRHVKYLAPANLSSVSSKQGNLHESVTVWLLSCLKPVHILHVESFFRANTIFEFHELCDSCITPDFNISLILVFTSSNMPGGIHLTLSLKGVSSFEGILCFTTVVWQESLSLCANKFGYCLSRFENSSFCSASSLVISFNFFMLSVVLWSCYCHLYIWPFDIGCPEQ